MTVERIEAALRKHDIHDSAAATDWRFCVKTWGPASGGAEVALAGIVRALRGSDGVHEALLTALETAP